MIVVGGFSQGEPLDGGLLFANYCQPTNGTLICTPVRLSVPSGDGKVAWASRLPEVRQPIDSGIISEQVLLMHGATIDREHGLVYWQAACAKRFFTTDIRSRKTKEFPLDFAALGIPGTEGGLCLNEWIFDESTGSAIALGGAPIPSGHGKIQFVFAVRADGSVTVLHDLRHVLDQERAFTHPNQTIVSFDPTRREILTGGTFVIGANPTDQKRLRVALDTGDVAVVNGGFGAQTQFFDQASSKHVFWNCFLPGLTDESSFEITISPADLAEVNLHSTTDLCYQGFLGGVHDPEEERFLFLARPGAVTRTTDRLSIGVIDLKTSQWSRWMATNSRHDTFNVTPNSGFNVGVIPGKTFFFSVVYAPCGGHGRRCR